MAFAVAVRRGRLAVWAGILVFEFKIYDVSLCALDLDWAFAVFGPMFYGLQGPWFAVAVRRGRLAV
jgi:hypothetical protein